MKIVSLCDYPQFIDTVANWTWNEFCKVDRPTVTLDQTKAKLKSQTQTSIPHTYVAVVDNKPVGTIAYYDNNLQGSLLTPWMGSLYVDPQMRGKSIARALILHIRMRAKREGYDTLYLRTEHTSKYYEKLGWTKVCDAVDPAHNLSTSVYKTALSGYRAVKKNDAWGKVELFDESAGTSAEIAIKRGGMLTSFYAISRDIVFMNWDTFYDVKSKLRGGMPVLFPICGRLADGKYELNSKTYELDIHGVARTLSWEFVSVDTEEAASLTIRLKADEETKKKYPFDFNVEYTYTLKGNKLTVVQKFKNLSSDVMPFSSGVHPYFNADRDTCAAYMGDKKFTFDKEPDFVVDDICARTVILDTGLGHSVKVVADENYNTYVFFSPEDAKYACAEPWSAAPNALNTKKNLLYLKAGEEKTLTVTIEAFLNK